MRFGKRAGRVGVRVRRTRVGPDYLLKEMTIAPLPNPPLQSDGRVGRYAPSCARR